MDRKICFFSFVVVFVVLPFGVGSAHAAKLAKSEIPQHEAGAVYFSVLNAFPFEQFAAQLSPQIPYKFDNALAQIAKSTTAEEYSTRDAFAMLLKIGATDQALSPNDLATAAQKPGIQGSTGNATGLPDKEKETGIPPMLHYSAAMALYQEIKLLEKSVMNAVTQKGYTPYIVRVQVTVMPFKRNLPLDVYSTLSFFSGLEVKWNNVAMTGYNLAWSDALKFSNAEKVTDMPKVLPLIVSENIELEAFSRSSQVYREYGLALMAAWKNVGAQAGFNNVVDKLRQSTGTDYNALLTTGRLTDNTIRVRLGAVRSPGGDDGAGYEMIPRNHTVSCLLLVPHGSESLDLFAKSEMRNQDGELLSTRTAVETRDMIEDILKTRIVPGIKKTPSSVLNRFQGAINAVMMNDMTAFINAIDSTVERIIGNNPKVKVNKLNYFQLWTEAAAILDAGQTGYAKFELSKDEYSLPKSGNSTQVLTIGNNHLSVEVVGGCNLTGRTLNVTLAVHETDEGKGGPMLPATRIDTSGDGTSFVATFASPKELGLSPEYIARDSVAYVRVGATNSTEPVEYPLFAKIIKEKPKPTPPPLAVDVQGVLPLAKGVTAAKLVVKFDKYKVSDPKKELVVRIGGADEKTTGQITSSSKETLGAAQTDGWRVLSGNGRFDVELINLYSEQKIAIECGVRLKEKPDEIKEIAVAGNKNVVVVKN